MGHRRPREPDQDPQALRPGQDAGDDVAGEGQAGDQRQQVQGASPVVAAEPRHHLTSFPVKVIRATHLVLCTPGAAGTMTRAG